MRPIETIILAILVVFSLAVAPIAFGWGSGWDDGWGSGWDDGWGSGWDDEPSDGFDDGEPDTGDEWGDDESGDTIIDFPPFWNTLKDQYVLEDSPDWTVVYPDLKKQCINPDGDPVNVEIVDYPRLYYGLNFSGDDLAIINLEHNYWDNGNIITLDCEGVASFFKLTIVAVDDSPMIIDLDELSTPVNQVLEVNLLEHEYDPDNSHDELGWSFIQRPSSQSLFNIELENKTLTITPRTIGEDYLTLRLEDTDGLYDEKDILVKITPVNVSRPPSPEREEREKISILVSSIRINGDGVLNAGDRLEAFVAIKNSGDIDLDDVKITMVIQEIAARGVTGRFDLDKGESVTKFVWMDIEENVQITDGIYDVRFTISNDDARRVVYREVDIVLDS